MHVDHRTVGFVSANWFIWQVRYVEDITAASRVERELALMKVRAPSGPARTEVIQLCEMFRARIMDVSGA